MSDISKLRDQLIREKGIYESQMAAANQAIQKFLQVIDGITEEEYSKMSNLGYSIDFLKTIDRDRLRADNEYVAQLSAELSEKLEQLFAKLEEEVNA